MMKNDQQVDLPEYYGDFGGIFVADSFTPDLDALGKSAREIILSDSFKRNFEVAIKALGIPEIDLQQICLKNGCKVIHASSQAEYYNIAGQIVLGAQLKAGLLVSGVDNPGSAIAFAKANRALNVKSLIFLNRKTGENEELIEQLKELSCEVDTKTCKELYNIPQMYAFQKYMENRRSHYFVPLEANIGPYPFPALVGYFSNMYGRKLIASLSNIPECCVVPIATGTNAIGVFRSLDSSEYRLVTVEEPVAQEYHGVFCGAFTIFTRMASGKDENVAICPELANMWRKARAIRLGCDHYGPVPTDMVDNLSFSPKVSRAIALAIKETGCKDMLVLEENL